ncbi:hypothetical protein SAMN05421788_110172 [Filimonas lacunae]|uniref:Uncharacterized protein n=1 Tax=Filimonas lacunae TaxID=477680 RepID=A0A173MA72_9BACT|nr:hypothetical protein [Filimonas lacunae]BAV04437.1 hypothetical protein FLA_0428 [Filimonas lacunae]SIT31443.1 hypothetical protein SAMN05421788_110172 [Filimonas lacunae]
MLTFIRQLYRRRTTSSIPTSSTHSNTILYRCQCRFAKALGRAEKKLSTTQKKILLLIYCTTGTLFFGALLLRPILYHRSSSPTRVIQSIPMVTLDTLSKTPLTIQQQHDTIIIKTK